MSKLIINEIKRLLIAVGIAALIIFSGCDGESLKRIDCDDYKGCKYFECQSNVSMASQFRLYYQQKYSSCLMEKYLQSKNISID